MRWLVVIVVIGAAAVYFGSPYWTAYQMQQAAEAGDADALAEHVDFERVRESLRPQVQTRVASEVDARAGDDEALRVLGGLAGGALADRAVDTYVTPEGLAKLMASAGAGEGETDVSLGYRGLDRFGIVLTELETGDVTELMLERDGVDWQVVEVSLPTG